MVHSICQNPVSRTINIAVQKVLYFNGKVLEGVYYYYYYYEVSWQELSYPKFLVFT